MRAMGAKTKDLQGRIKQAAGALTGNAKLERKGRVDRKAAKATGRLEQVTAKAEQAIDKTADAINDAIGTGKKSRRSKKS
jgi:uncharacterized protein YjbJ (UPF0337 family)